MPAYVLSFHDPKMHSSPEEGQAHMKKYLEWTKGLGDAIIRPDTPLKNPHRVSASGVEEGAGDYSMMGFMMFEATDMDAALEIAKACPFTSMGTMVVREAVDMSKMGK